ncbi:MAG: hypothetical protein JXQ99_06330 [Hyphomicrobiaceae bacterium]
MEEQNSSSDRLQGATAQVGNASASPPTRDELEQRVLGAVRQAVTDVMQENRQPTDLPKIDMDFVATSQAPSNASPLLGELNHPPADDASPIEQIIQTSDLKSPHNEKPVTPFVLGGIGLVLIVAALVLTLPGNDNDLFGTASNSATERQVAKLSEQPEQIHASGSEFLSDHSSAAESSERKGATADSGKLNATSSSDPENDDTKRKRKTDENDDNQSLTSLGAVEQQLLGPVAQPSPQEDQAIELKRLDVLRAAEEKAKQEAAKRALQQQHVAKQKRVAAQRAAEERAEREAAARRLKQQEQEAERQRVAKLRAAVEVARREAAKRKQLLAEQAERVRVAMLREAEQRSRSEAAKRKRMASIRAKKDQALAAIGIHDQRQMDELLAATKKRLQSEGVITERLNAAVEESRQARLRLDRLQNNAGELPAAWAAEEKARLKLERVLTEISNEQSVAAAPRLRTGPTLARDTVTLQLKESNLKISGNLIAHDARNFVVQLPSNERVTLPVEHFKCISTSCPKTVK